MKNHEIERKWIVEEFPSEMTMLDERYVEQTYLSNKPEVRIRKSQLQDSESVSYRLTIKSSPGMDRIEIEKDLTADEYEALLTVAGSQHTIKKHRRTYRLSDGHILEVSEVDPGDPEGYMFAEVEFDSAEDANNFKLIPYLEAAKEVTGDPYYSMSNYARMRTISHNKMIDNA